MIWDKIYLGTTFPTTILARQHSHWGGGVRRFVGFVKIPWWLRVSFRARTCLSRVLFVADNHGGLSSRCGFKLLDSSTGRWLVFLCRDVADYSSWLEAFSAERRVVTENQRRGFDVTSLTKLTNQLPQQPVKGTHLKPRPYQ